MNRILLSLVALSIALTSCSRDNDDVTNNPIVNPVTQQDLLSEISWKSTTTGQHLGNNHSDTNSGKITFSYDGDKIKEIISGFNDNGFAFQKSIKFQYTEDKITAISWEDTGVSTHMNLTYNTDGTLKSSIATADNLLIPNAPRGISVIKREYTYNNDIITIKETVRDANGDIIVGGGGIPDIEYSYKISNGNPIEDHQYSKTTYTYDNKLNPLTKIKGFKDIGIAFLDLYDNNLVSWQLSNFLFNNNLTGVEKIIKTNYPKDQHLNGKKEINTKISYEYNDKNLPTKAVKVENPDIVDTRNYQKIETSYIYTYK